MMWFCFNLTTRRKDFNDVAWGMSSYLKTIFFNLLDSHFEKLSLASVSFRLAQRNATE